MKGRLKWGFATNPEGKSMFMHALLSMPHVGQSFLDRKGLAEKYLRELNDKVSEDLKLSERWL
ncbi:MAG: hypothetical protein QXE22_01180 [Candidatus Bathyarchaeia archaeon]